MKSTYLTTTTISIEKKVLARLKKMSQKSSANGNGPHQSVSELVRAAVKQYLEGAK